MLPGSFARPGSCHGRTQNGKHGLLPCSALPTSHVLESLHIHTHVNEEAHAKKFRVCCCLWKSRNSLNPSRVKKEDLDKVQARFNKILAPQCLGSANLKHRKMSKRCDSQPLQVVSHVQQRSKTTGLKKSGNCCDI